MGSAGFPNKNGKPVVDATKDLVVQVTKACVNRSKPMDPTACAVAEALKLKKGVVSARVQIRTSYIEYASKIVRYMTPESAAREIISFDRHGPFDTGEYILKAPSPTRRLGYQRERDPNRKRGPHKPVPHRTLMVRGT